MNLARGATAGCIAPSVRLAGSGGTCGDDFFSQLEDRLIKRAFASLVRSGRAVDLTRGGLVASEEEANAIPELDPLACGWCN